MGPPTLTHGLDQASGTRGASDPIPPIAALVDVSVAYDAAPRRFALRGVSLAIQPGEAVAILGASGCGKSTLLRTLLGLLRPTSGQVLADGRPLAGVHPRAALVFQSFALFPWLTVKRNIAVALEDLGLAPADAEARIAHVIDLIGLDGFEEAYPKELSGGMKQRVGFARALARAPALLCLDEPFSGLDVFTAETLRREIYRLMSARSGPVAGVESVVIVTHDIAEAVFIADRVVVMGRDPGHIRQIVPVPLPRPRDPHGAAFQTAVRRLRELFAADILGADAPSALDDADRVEPLPDVRIAEIVGALTVLHQHHDTLDVFTLHDVRRGHDLAHTLAILKAAEMLDFVDTPQNDVLLTELGREVIAADLNGQKAIVRRQLLTLGTFRAVRERLAREPGGRLSRAAVIAELAARMPHQDAAALFDTIVHWARWGELFGYESESAVLYLDEPVPTATGQRP